jgi:hypothetical protein
MKNSWHDFPEMLPDAATKGVRRKDPPSASQLAAERGRDRERGAKDVSAKLAEMLAREMASPAPGSSKEFVDAGGLVTYGVNYPDLYS